MEYSNDWLRLRKAEDEYFTCRYNFMQNEDAFNNLKLALTKASDKGTALRLLLEMRPEVSSIIPLLPEIIDIVIDTTGLDGIALAKDVLYNYRNEIQIKGSIMAFISNYLTNNDEWHFRRIYELYSILNYKEELANFLSLCQVNDNWEIREIADNYLNS